MSWGWAAPLAARAKIAAKPKSRRYLEAALKCRVDRIGFMEHPSRKRLSSEPASLYGGSAPMSMARTRPFNSNAALKWVLQNKNISSIISGMSSVEELRKNLEMIKDLKLSDQELEDLKLAALRPEMSLYCRQCQKCIPQCPANLDIPTLMRSYMYAYGYRDAAQARHTLDSVELSGDPCGKCDICSVACASGFDVKDRIRDIARLKSVPMEFLIGPR